MLQKVRKLVKYLKTTMTSNINSLEPPLAVLGMKILDRNAFQKNVVVPCIAVPKNSLKICTKKVKSVMVRLPNNPAVVESSLDIAEGIDPSKFKLVLLQPGTTMDVLKEELNLNTEELSIPEQVYQHKCCLGYDNFTTRQIFKAVIPAEEVLSSFTQTGHLAHVNLREHLLPFKGLIGQVLLDKIPTAKTIVHKPHIIENEFRNFELELVAGEEDYIVTTVEYGLKYKFDFSKVFWNSRLSTEHRRLVDLIKKEEVVFDVFAGVGPFSIPAAKKGCHVFANDLNPESHKWLNQNATANKVKLKAFCMDGREFLRKELKAYLLEKPNPQAQVHIIMNLPAIAVEFLDVFNGLLAEKSKENSEHFTAGTAKCEAELQDVNLPCLSIHCHSFAPAEGGKVELKAKVLQYLGHALPQNADIHFVRNVSTNKHMYCVSFVVSNKMLFGKTCEVEKDLAGEPCKKRLKQ